MLKIEFLMQGFCLDGDWRDVLCSLSTCVETMGDKSKSMENVGGQIGRGGKPSDTPEGRSVGVPRLPYLGCVGGLGRVERVHAGR